MVLLLCISSYLFAQNSPDRKPVNDEDITVRSFEEMNYPSVARAAHREGVVVIRVELNDNGLPTSASAVSGPKMLIPDALANAKKWNFRVNSERAAVIIYDFRLVEGKCDPGRNRLFVFRSPNVASVQSCTDVWQP
jgi:TonB family protein